MKNFLTRIIAMVAVISALGRCMNSIANLAMMNGSRTGVPFSEMVYEPIDAKDLAKQIDQLTAQIAACSEFEEADALDDRRIELYRNYSTMNTLAYLHYNIDTSDSYWEEEYARLMIGWGDMEKASNDFLVMLEAYWGEAFTEAYGVGYFPGEDWSDEMVALAARESELTTEQKAIVGTGTVDFAGEALTFNDIQALDGEQYFEALDLWLDKYNEPLAALYIELVDIRNDIAQQLGYDSYAAYAYALHGYDFTPEMVGTLLDGISEEIVPVYEALLEVGTRYYPDVSMDYGAFMNLLSHVFDQFGGTFPEVLDFMVKNELIHAEPGRHKLHGAYTTYIPDYDSPFILLSYTEDPNSMTTLIHEFGHFYSWYHNGGISGNTATDEIFSQALELLVANHYGDAIDGQKAYEMRYDAISGLFDYMVNHTYTKFEFVAYEMKDLTVDKLNDLYAQCDEEFRGSSDYMDRDLYSRSWVAETILFEQPYYMIAYTVAVDAVFQIWEISLEEEKEALHIYNQMIENTTSMGLMDNLANVGLGNIFHEGRLGEIAQMATSVLVNEEMYTQEMYAQEMYAEETHTAA